MNAIQLQGKTALVTGASSGLGVDFARQLAQYGCSLILVARRADRLRTLADEITRQYNVSATPIPLDLLEPEAPQKLYDLIREAGLQVDVLVNNAGYAMHGQFVDLPWEREKGMLELDMLVLTHLTKLFVKDMLERNTGWVLQVSSIGAFQPTPTYASYSAAKSYVLSFGEALNYELRRSNVSCTVVAPGVTATEFLKVAGQQPTLYERLIMMQSKDVARIGINSMLKRRSSVVPGWLNSVMAFSNRLTPRRVSTMVAELMMTIQ